MNKLQKLKLNSVLEDEAYKHYMVERETKLSSIRNERAAQKKMISDELQKKSLCKCNNLI